MTRPQNCFIIILPASLYHLKDFYKNYCITADIVCKDVFIQRFNHERRKESVINRKSQIRKRQNKSKSDECC